MKTSAIFIFVLGIINSFMQASENKIDPECLNRSYYGYYCYKHLNADELVSDLAP